MDVKWYKDGSPIDTSDGSAYRVETNELKVKDSDNSHYETILFITGTAAQSHGEYTVSVSNYRGYSDMVVYLHKRQSGNTITLFINLVFVVDSTQYRSLVISRLANVNDTGHFNHC